MSTLLLALVAMTTPAEASSAAVRTVCSSLSSDAVASTDACACVRRSLDQWWAAVDLSDPSDPVEAGTCFEVGVLMSDPIFGLSAYSSDIEKALQYKAKNYAWERDYFFNAYSDELSSMGDMDDIDLPIDEGSDLDLLPGWLVEVMHPNFQDEVLAVVDVEGRPVASVDHFDHDGDGVPDLFLMFEDQDAWLVPGPIEPGEVVRPPEMPPPHQPPPPPPGF